MLCPHCCFNCTSKGEDMSLETFKEIVMQDTECICIGGGEPTLHPKFMDILLYAIAVGDSVWMATNGAITETALMLAKLGKLDNFTCRLSLDEYHEPIDTEVETAFWEAQQNYQRGFVSYTESGKIINAGRARKSGLYSDAADICPCSEMFVRPQGTIHYCGCSNSPIVSPENDEIFYNSCVEDQGYCWNKRLEEYKRYNKKQEVILTEIYAKVGEPTCSTYQR